ncbi:MAG: sulfite exporter TauE/SafE family protein [Rhodothermales bacterium]
MWEIDLSVWNMVLFAVAGVVTGGVNTLAGSGSLITLPIFVFICGLPAPVANGTNRIGVILQTVTGLATYRGTGRMNLDGASRPVVSALAGALVGSRIAVGLDAETMNLVLGVLMLVMLVILVARPSRWIHEMPVSLERSRSPVAVVVFFLIGVYGGFIQAGVGIFLLAALVLISRYTLSSGNAVKLLIVAAYGLPTLAIFLWYDQVHFGYGLAMAFFQSIGAWLGVKYIVPMPHADVWIHRLLIVMVALAAIKFLSEF